MQIKNVRFIIAVITTFSAYAVYMSRVNLSIAIIAMVDDRHSAENQKASEPNVAMQKEHANLSALQSPSSSTSSISSLDNRTLTVEGNASKHSPQASFFLSSQLKTPLISQEKFHWDQTEQGHILGAFFYGYILFQIPGARMSESVGAKWIIMVSSAGSAVISLAFPLSTQLNSIYLLMMLRFVMGLCQSAFFPAAYVLFCRWLPEHERSVLLPIMFIGANMGSISTYILSSYLISSASGWPSVFYLSGLVCSIVSLLCCVFVSNGPDDNWLITDKERRYIERNVNNQSSESNSLSEQPTSLVSVDHNNNNHNNNNNNSNNNNHLQSAQQTTTKLKQDKQLDLHESSNSVCEKADERRTIAPDPSWPKLIKSIPIWVFILSMYGNEWSNVVICYELPTYLNTALNFPIEQNGVINSFFQLSFAVASPIVSSLGAYMLDKHLFGMRKIHVRKLFQSLATFGQLACFLSVPICGANRELIIMFMFLAIVFKSCANAGDIMVAGDLSPEYAGTIFAFANSIGNTAGFVVPLLAGVFVENAYQREQWTPFWLTTAAIMASSGLIFLIFGDTRRQDYSREDEGVEAQNKGRLELAEVVRYDKIGRADKVKNRTSFS